MQGSRAEAAGPSAERQSGAEGRDCQAVQILSLPWKGEMEPFVSQVGSQLGVKGRGTNKAIQLSIPRRDPPCLILW